LPLIGRLGATLLGRQGPGLRLSVWATDRGLFEVEGFGLVVLGAVVFKPGAQHLLDGRLRHHAVEQHIAQLQDEPLANHVIALVEPHQRI
jgi:hypothetical protein